MIEHSSRGRVGAAAAKFAVGLTVQASQFQQSLDFLFQHVAMGIRGDEPAGLV